MRKFTDDIHSSNSSDESDNSLNEDDHQHDESPVFFKLLIKRISINLSKGRYNVRNSKDEETQEESHQEEANSDGLVSTGIRQTKSVLNIKYLYQHGNHHELFEILENKETTHLFKQYLKMRRSEENLYFWIDAEMFANPLSTPDDKMEEKSQFLFNKYFAEKANYSLNLDDEIVQIIMEKYRQKQVDRKTFVDAQNAVFKLMETACVSKSFTDFCKLKLDEKMKRKKLDFLSIGRRLTKQRAPIQLSAESLNLETYFTLKQSS